MKKWFGMILALLLCIGTAQAEEQWNAFFSDGETAYQLADGALWRLDEALQPREKLCDTNATAGFADERGIVLACPIETGYRFEWLNGEALFELETGRWLREFVMTEDIVLARWQFLEAEAPHGECFADECPLAAYDLEGNEVRAPFDTSTAIAAAQNGEIWVTNGRGGDLHIWSPVEHREEWVGKYGPIALSGLENGVAYVDEDALVCLLEEGKAPRSIGTIDRYREAADLLGIFTCGNRLAAYWRWNEPRMQTWSLEEPSEATDTITLVNCADWYDDCMNAAITMWKEAHPDGSVQFADLSGE